MIHPTQQSYMELFITQSGTSITVGTPVLLISGSSSGICGYLLFIFYKQVDSSLLPKGFQYASVIISISGTTPSIGTPISDSFQWFLSRMEPVFGFIRKSRLLPKIHCFRFKLCCNIRCWIFTSGLSKFLWND